jgi:carbamoyl-phosphate synthase large subunit
MKAMVLISSAGRRVGLLNCFRNAFEELGVEGRIVAIDESAYSSAAQLADAFYKVPGCLDPEFATEVEYICERESINLVVPTIDTELPVYVAIKERIGRCGTKIGISAPETVAICQDKVLTSQWLAARQFPTPRQACPAAVLSNGADWHMPLIVKPRSGSASIGVRRITSLQELALAAQNEGDLIVQEVVDGQEFTVNVFLNGLGECLCAVPTSSQSRRGV